MDVIRCVRDMQAWSRARHREGRRIGLVPTMGYLHEGHLSLVRTALAQSDDVVVSIFVNPMQFGPGEDLEAYPRDFVRDAELCRQAGVAVIFHPEPAGMYAPDFSTSVEEHALSKGLCGRRRPGHFRGVATVVAKLFNAVLPDIAVFGQKDAQQASVIRRMARDLDFPVEIVVAPIVREPDGLAMSSRNTYLKGSLRDEARCLRRALDEGERLFQRGERRASVLREAMESVIRPVTSARIDYIEIVDLQTLEPVERAESPTLVALAVKVGSTRLIDNAVLGGQADGGAPHGRQGATTALDAAPST